MYYPDLLYNQNKRKLTVTTYLKTDYIYNIANHFYFLHFGMSKIIITHNKIFPKKLEKLTLQMSNLLVNNYH